LTCTRPSALLVSAMLTVSLGLTGGLVVVVVRRVVVELLRRVVWDWVVPLPGLDE
jgi:hypothetical protein